MKWRAEGVMPISLFGGGDENFIDEIFIPPLNFIDVIWGGDEISSMKISLFINEFDPPLEMKWEHYDAIVLIWNMEIRKPKYWNAEMRKL